MMKLSRRRNTKDDLPIRNYLSKVMREARARGDEDITLGVGSICTALGMESKDGYAACCSVLDSKRFARTHAVWYHHRLGSWGTESAEYVFLLGKPGYRAVPQSEIRASPWRGLQAMAIMAVLVMAALLVWLLATLFLA